MIWNKSIIIRSNFQALEDSDFVSGNSLFKYAGVRQSQAEEGEKVEEDFALCAISKGCIAGMFLVVLDGEGVVVGLV